MDRFTVWGYDKNEFDNYCVDLMRQGFTLTRIRMFLEFPWFWKRLWIAEIEREFTALSLLNQLQVAIDLEDYEEAARLRNLINSET